jgi:hypothetical protein
MKSFTRCTVATRAGWVYVPAVAFSAPTVGISTIPKSWGRKEHTRCDCCSKDGNAKCVHSSNHLLVRLDEALSPS